MEPLPVVDLADLLKTPPLPTKVRRRVGYLLRKIQNGEVLTMPDSRPLPSVGKRVHELRLTELNTEWRINYRIDPDALIAVDVFQKKTQKTPLPVIERCKKRLQYLRQFRTVILKEGLMDAAKRKRLELAGYKIYDDAADWLGLTEEEKTQLDLRETMARAVKALRESSGLTQAQLAERIKSKQPKIANLEAGRGGFTLDYAAKVYRAMGGKVTIKTKPPRHRKAKPGREPEASAPGV